jgi:hypothetical protein
MLRGVKAPAERTTTANLLVTLRKARGFTAGKAAAAHVREQTGVVGLSDSVWASYESGTRKISDKHRAAIEDVFGSLGEDAQPAAPSSDMAALIAAQLEVAAAMRAQTAAITALVERLDRQATELPEWAEATVRAAMAGVQLGTAAKGSSAPPAPDGPPRSRSGSEG